MARHHATPPNVAAACNDNGCPAACAGALAPRGILSAVRRTCGPIELNYLATGTLRISGTSRPRASAAA